MELRQYLFSLDFKNAGGHTQMECYCYLRNVQDLLGDGQTHYERGHNSPFDGPDHSCGSRK